jgi:hypothetical protein
VPRRERDGSLQGEQTVQAYAEACGEVKRNGRDVRGGMLGVQSRVLFLRFLRRFSGNLSQHTPGRPKQKGPVNVDCTGPFMERVAGIEPASQAWEACALPLDDTRRCCS